MCFTIYLPQLHVIGDFKCSDTHSIQFFLFAPKTTSLLLVDRSSCNMMKTFKVSQWNCAKHFARMYIYYGCWTSEMHEVRWSNFAWSFVVQSDVFLVFEFNVSFLYPIFYCYVFCIWMHEIAVRFRLCWANVRTDMDR